MKKLIALIFIITSNYTYAQFSIKNLISMSKLNIENFEILSKISMWGDGVLLSHCVMLIRVKNI